MVTKQRANERSCSDVTKLSLRLPTAPYRNLYIWRFNQARNQLINLFIFWLICLCINLPIYLVTHSFVFFAYLFTALFTSFLPYLLTYFFLVLPPRSFSIPPPPSSGFCSVSIIVVWCSSGPRTMEATRGNGHAPARGTPAMMMMSRLYKSR